MSADPLNDKIDVNGDQVSQGGDIDWNKEVGTYFVQDLYELVGIFFFVTTIYFTNGDVSKFVFGFWVILSFFGSYSGAHVNPAITLGFYIYEGKWATGFVKMLFYWAGQFLGALLASKLAYYLTHKRIFVGIPIRSSPFEVLFAESLFTGTFLFVILFICSSTTAPKDTSAPVKCAVIVGWFYCAVQMGAAVSGAAYNPAILFALNLFEYLVGNAKAFNLIPEMILAELVGVIVFALLFKLIFERAYKKILDKEAGKQ